ncbi:MAG: hypothetical protein LH654_03300 [Thermoleophilia bacterium]|nr:hypothetical protein [Thermoleophilia bacterium]
MSRGLASWVAWAIVAVTLALHSFSIVLVVLGRNVDTPGDGNLDIGAVGFFVAFLAFSLVGAVIVTRRHRNAIGWLLLLIGLTLGISDSASTYADYAIYADPGSLPVAPWVGWVAGWGDPLFLMSVMLVLLLFPDGKVPSRRWRPVLWLTLAAGALAVLWNALKPDKIFSDSLPIDNPAGIQWLGSHLGFIDQFVFVGFSAAFFLSVAAAVVRFRRSRGIERDRMKWLALAAVLMVAGFVVAVILGAAGSKRFDDLAVGLAFSTVPIAVGIGVLRYRLYEIDRVISRTLSFAVVTLNLGAMYVGLVLIGQYVFSSVAGGGGLVIAASTLVVAALFLPVRSRVQRFVDRRFNRKRYDAQRTLEAFGTRLREQVELDQLTTGLRDVVGETMQPAHVAVWLRHQEVGGR